MTLIPERVCTVCGTSNAESASFCQVCDTFLGWLDDESPEGTAAADTPTADPGTGAATGADAAAAPPPRDRVRPPVVSTESTEVVVAADAPGTFQMVVRNNSTIVDSYVIQVDDPPSWLTVAHSDTNLLPDETRTVQVTLAVLPMSLAIAQRIEVTLSVRSGVDTTQAAEVPMTVVVPPFGPPATLVAHPTLVRLVDRGQGAFAVRLDNRAANHPRRYRLTASDPEGVVMLDFVPSVVDVPPGETADATVRFAAPEPAMGEEVTRQLTVTATDEEGPVTVPVTIVQETSTKLPVRLRLEPSQVSATDTPYVDLDIVVDNRGGHEDAVVSLKGRDPANAISFRFDHNGITVAAGRAVRFGMHLGSAPPPRGETVTRPFTVVATAGGSEAEVSGTFELTSSASAITTAQLRVVPEHLVVSSRRGTFAVDVDNRNGTEHLPVHLSGADEYGRARLRFSPADVTVPPGQQVRASLVVEHPRPPGGGSESRRVQVFATSGTDSIQAEAVFTQHAQSYRRLWAILTTLLGVVLIVLGVIVYVDDPRGAGAEGDIRALITAAMDGSMPADEQVRTGIAVAALAVVLLCAFVIALGMTSRTGRGVKGASIVAALGGVAATVSSMVFGGLVLVVAGAVIAFIGGILLRAST